MKEDDISKAGAADSSAAPVDIKNMSKAQMREHIVRQVLAANPDLQRDRSVEDILEEMTATVKVQKQAAASEQDGQADRIAQVFTKMLNAFEEEFKQYAEQIEKDLTTRGERLTALRDLLREELTRFIVAGQKGTDFAPTKAVLQEDTALLKSLGIDLGSLSTAVKLRKLNS